MSSLTDLLSRVEGATGADVTLEAELLRAVMPEALWPDNWRSLSFSPMSSLDAALELCERVLPGWWWAVGRYGPDGLVSANVSRDGKKHGADVMAPTPALALISAMLRALIAAEESR